MFRTANFRVCNCCGGKAWPRKRVCDTCKVPAIWRAPTEAEVAAERGRASGRGDVQRFVGWEALMATVGRFAFALLVFVPVALVDGFGKARVDAAFVRGEG